MMKQFTWLLLTLILLGGFVVRLYRFDGPIADWQSWRQADTSAVSRSFAQNGFHLLTPTYEDISNVPSGLDNPHGYRMVEFPIYNAAQAGLYAVFGQLTIEEWGRVVTIFTSLLTSLFLYLIVKRHVDAIAGLFSAFFFTFIPFDIYYGRSILPDVSMGAMVLGGIYFFDLWLSETRRQKQIFWFVLSVLFSAISLLLKPFAIFFLVPMLFLVWSRYGFSLFKQIPLYIYALLVVAPLAFWRVWIKQYPAGIASNTWLFNGGNVRFRPSYFYWVYGERLGKLITGYWGTALLTYGVIYGFIEKRTKQYTNMYFFLSFLLGSFLYITIIARGNLQHDYYQILVMPTVALFMGLGAHAMFMHGRDLKTRVNARIVLVIVTLLSLAFGMFYVRDYFNINNPAIITAGKAVDAMTPKNARVIAPYDGDTSFLYATNRQGWASFEKPIEQMMQMGADYLVLVHPSQNDINGFGKQYNVVSLTPEYLLVKLK